MKYRPNYKRLFQDMISKKYPDKECLCKHILTKETITTFDVIELSKIISRKNNSILGLNQKFKAYDKKAIFIILEYQKINRLNNSQTAKHFDISRNTITKWKRLYISIL